MIVPMKRFYLITLDSDRNKAPELLRTIGVAHVEELQGSSETCRILERERSDTQTAHFLLQNYAQKSDLSRAKKELAAIKSGKGKVTPALLQEGRTRVDDVMNLKQEMDNLNERRSQLARELDRVESWGEVCRSQLEALETELNLSIRLYEGPFRAARDIPENVEYVILASPKGRLRIVTVSEKGSKEASLPSVFQEFEPPEKSASAMKQEMASISARYKEIETELRALASSLTPIQILLSILEDEVRLEHLKAGMPAQDRLCYLKGFVPARDVEKMKTLAAQHGWAVGFSDPAPDELPPTLVENRPAIQIIEPIFEFLGTIPNYREYDISMWFLLFFSLFFAMIFGDAGYGLLILAGSIASILASRAKGRKPGNAQILFALLGGVTVIWGALTATWFGIGYNQLPPLLKSLSLDLINGRNPADSERNIKVFCFIIGLVQLSIAHFKNIRRDFPDLKFLSQAGSLLLLAGMFNAALNLVIDATRFPIRSWALLCIAVGFGLVFLFGNWNGKLGSSIVESLKGLIPTFLGTVSVFADIVSYIRLWAVGLAGLAISQTVNGMAGNILQGASGFIVGFIIKAFIAVILLVVSHSMNFVLTVLSVVVHGIRLNMLEFSGHLGMEWSGYKYDPLRENPILQTIQHTSGEETDV